MGRVVTGLQLGELVTQVYLHVIEFVYVCMHGRMRGKIKWCGKRCVCVCVCVGGGQRTVLWQSTVGGLHRKRLDAQKEIRYCT